MRAAVLALLGLAGCPSAHRYPDGSGLQAQLEREVVALQARVRTLEEDLLTCGEDTGPDTIYQELHQVMSGMEIEVAREGNTTLLTFPADLLFSRGTDLRDEARMPLDILATAISLHPEYTVTVEGHTDDRQPAGDLRRLYADNWALSWSRAETVMHILSTEFGIPEERFTLKARAHYDPVATNDTSAGQALNRRVVVRLIPPRG